jgi:hypothetical protein
MPKSVPKNQMKTCGKLKGEDLEGESVYDMCQVMNGLGLILVT